MTEFAPECSFDTFIDADLILDSTTSPTEDSSTPSGHANIGKGGIIKPSPLTGVSSHFSHEGPPTPTIVEGFQYHPNASTTSTSSPLTSTPSSALSHPASLHNLSFDFSFADSSHSQTSISPFSSDVGAGVSVKEAIASGLPASAPLSSRPMSSPSHWNGLGVHTDTETFMPQASMHGGEHLEQQSGPHHEHQHAHHNHHHGRSLSLHDVAPPTTGSDVDATMAPLPFPAVKVKMESEADSNAPSPTTEDHSSPSSSQPSMSIFDHGSPPMEKKRRLASPAESFTSFTSSVKSGTDASTTMSTEGPTTPSSVKKVSTNQKRSRNNTLSKQPDQLSQQPSSEGKDEKQPVNQEQQQQQQQQPSQSAQGEQQQPSQEQQAPPKTGNKRPPPSASQFTESGMPFPVIDTSAKHSSLFVPPDTSGLTKREARLVKNRAAAFLSRQRKREQFEELDQKCRHLCRATWRMWEVIVGPGRDWEAYSSSVLPMLMSEEHPEVAQSLEQVVMLKGGSIAPTEDGQLQGAVAAGIDMQTTSSMAAKGSEPPTVQSSGAAPSQAPATAAPTPATTNATAVPNPPSIVQNPTKGEDNGEIARLRAEIAQLQQSQTALRLELANEKAMRSESELEQQRRPFRPSAQASQDISLTIAPQEHTERRRGVAKGSRSSERIQRQQVASSGLASQPGGQRKAAGAALMMVLFSFALFGLPGGQMTRLGGVSTTGNMDDFSLGKVLGAPISNGAFGLREDEDDDDVSMQPSSHLSAHDLLPPDVSDLLTLEDTHLDDTPRSGPSKQRRRGGSLSTLQQMLASSDGALDIDQWIRDYHADDDEEAQEQRMAGEAFARDLTNSLGRGYSGVDIERGFVLIGTPEGHGKEESSMDVDKQPSGESDAPTRLTLFVPAPDFRASAEVQSPHSSTDEDRFYDAPLAKDESNRAQEQTSAAGAEISQNEATRAALRVLREHRLSSSTSASRPSSSHRVKALRRDSDESIEDDFETMASPIDVPASQNFYELNFSLSGAKVRGVKELSGLILAAGRRRLRQEEEV